MDPHSLIVMHTGAEAAISGRTYLLRALLHLVAIGGIAVAVFLVTDRYSHDRSHRDDPGR